LTGGYSHYLVDCLSIIVIDLLLAGDNALIIAMAVRALPKPQRRVALLSGAWLAVVIRVAVTFLAAKLLQVEFIQFGLALSIPLVISSSTLLARIMDKYPLTMYLGSAILGRVGGEMMLGDAFVRRLFHPSDVLRYAIEAALVAAIVLIGSRLNRH
jgi:predicted tellurium resistance membrane protein TerC